MKSIVRNTLSPFEIDSFLPLHYIVSAVAFPERTWKVDSLSEYDSSCSFPDRLEPCTVVEPLNMTENSAVAPFAPSSSLFPLVGQFLHSTAWSAPFAADTEMSSLTLFFLLSLDAFSDDLELLDAEDLLDFEDDEVFDDFDALELLRLDETDTLSESAGIVCFGPDCENSNST